jgi:hypothetical protein
MNDAFEKYKNRQRRNHRKVDDDEGRVADPLRFRMSEVGRLDTSIPSTHNANRDRRQTFPVRVSPPVCG